MAVELALSEQNAARWGAEESARCDACGDLISGEDREAYLLTGLCAPCDSRLNPYPARPTREDQNWPGGMDC